MIISRWQAPLKPQKELLKMLFEAENIDWTEESFSAQDKIQEHRHPFCEVRIIVEGEMLFNIAGTQFLLREGDRVEIPANTKHSYTNQSNSACVSICGYKAM
jgi:quercetin dioxygenase-like cupin family protein